MQKNNVLVTGCAGFIGSNLAEELWNQGHSVFGIDIDTKKKENLSFALGETQSSYGSMVGIDRFRMIWDDINKVDSYKIFLNNIDTIYHLAASADVRKSLVDPTCDLYNNVNGTNSILELMRKADIKNLVFASSSAMYGDTKVIPTPEDLPDIRPNSMYAASKVANEAFINAYCNIYGMKAWMFRFSHVIGRHEHRGVIIDLIAKLNKNVETLEILGDGNQGKSFFDVADCVRGLIEIPQKDKNKSVEIYNLANTDSMKIKQVAKIVCEEIGVNPIFKYTGGIRGWPGDTPNTILDITKALSVGWKPKYDCKTAVRNTVKYLFERK